MSIIIVYSLFPSQIKHLEKKLIVFAEFAQKNNINFYQNTDFEIITDLFSILFKCSSSLEIYLNNIKVTTIYDMYTSTQIVINILIIFLTFLTNLFQQHNFQTNDP